MQQKRSKNGPAKKIQATQSDASLAGGLFVADSGPVAATGSNGPTYLIGSGAGGGGAASRETSGSSPKSTAEKKLFAVCVIGDNLARSAVLEKEHIRTFLIEAFYGENWQISEISSDTRNEERARWNHFVTAKNWFRGEESNPPIYYEYFDGESVIRAFRVTT